MTGDASICASCARGWLPESFLSVAESILFPNTGERRRLEKGLVVGVVGGLSRGLGRGAIVSAWCFPI